MKLIATTVLVALTSLQLTAQVKVQNLKVMPVKNQMVIKGSVPFMTKGTGTFKNIQLTSGGNKTSFSMQRGSLAAKRTVLSPDPTPDLDANGRYCTEEVVSEEKGDYNKIVLGNQNDKIYPGAIYFDNAFITGEYNAPTDLELRPYQITTDLFSAATSGSSVMETQPSVGAYNDALSELLRRSTNVRNASKIDIDVKTLSSTDQLAFEMGASFNGYGVDLAADFAYMKRSNKNVFIAKLTQVYFSTMLNRADGRLLAGAHPNAANLVYVHKVNYGRLGYLIISSDSSRETIEASLDFTYSSGSVSVGANARLAYERTLSSMQIRGFFFGGDAANTININTPNQLRSFGEYVARGLRLDPNVAPVAISYELKYLNDNSTAATKSATTYTERICTPAKGIKIQLHNVVVEDVHSGDCSYAWGDVDVELWETNSAKQPVNMIWNSKMWSHTAGAPNRTVINHADVRAGNEIRSDVKNIPNGTREITLNPMLVNEKRILVRIKLNINTRHKDNDFAALGFHGMNRTEVIDKMLNEVFVGSEQLASRASSYKYGTFMAGKFCSNTDRVHCFWAMFTFTNN